MPVEKLPSLQVFVINFFRFIGPNGLIRATGRVTQLEKTFDVKHPILLDTNHPAVGLFLDHFHSKHFFLFTCLTTRAVQFEVVSSMDTSSCVKGIEIHVSHRGVLPLFWP